MKLISPCIDCKTRYEACHDFCEKFKEYNKVSDNLKYKKKISKQSYTANRIRKKIKRN